MNKPPEAKSQARVIPPTFRFRHDFDWFRRLTLWERVKIAIGCNLFLRVQFFTVNSPGAVQPVFIGAVSKEKSAIDQMIAEHDAGNPGPKT